MNYTESIKYGSTRAENKYVRAADDLPGAGSLGLSKTQAEKERKRQAKATISVEHIDIIKDDFWDQRPWLSSNR